MSNESLNLPPIPVVEKSEAPFFSVSLLKLAVMDATTFNLYSLYWTYCNWKLIQQRTRDKISPFWRAFFGFFWIYQLLVHVRRFIQDSPVVSNKTKFMAGPLAASWIILSLLYKLPSYGFFLSMFAFIPLLIAQKRMNEINAAVAPQEPINSRFTWANWIGIVIGSTALVLLFLATLRLQEHPWVD